MNRKAAPVFVLVGVNHVVELEFQVVIEGVRGIQHEGDIAIDDVSFTSGCKRVGKVVADISLQRVRASC